jgi:hypothetical protein
MQTFARMDLLQVAMAASYRSECSALRRAIERLGARTLGMECSAAGLRKGAVLVARGRSRRALLASPLREARSPHDLPRALAAAKFALFTPAAVPLDARDVAVLHDGKGALLGHGFGSSQAAAKSLEIFLGAPVLSLELSNPDLPRLSQAVALLADGTALVCEDALRPSSIELLRAHRAVRRVVRVPRFDAARGGLDLIELGDTIFICAGARWVASALELLGRRVVRVDMRRRRAPGLGPGSIAVPIQQIELVRAGFTRAVVPG